MLIDLSTACAGVVWCVSSSGQKQRQQAAHSALASLLLSDPLDWTASLRCSFVQYYRIVRHPHGHRFPLEAEIAFGYDACKLLVHTLPHASHDQTWTEFVWAW